MPTLASKQRAKTREAGIYLSCPALCSYNENKIKQKFPPGRVSRNHASVVFSPEKKEEKKYSVRPSLQFPTMNALRNEGPQNRYELLALATAAMQVASVQAGQLAILQSMPSRFTTQALTLKLMTVQCPKVQRARGGGGSGLGGDPAPRAGLR